MVLDEAMTQPLKASVSNADRSSDQCFLKIDGGSLNPIAAVRRFKDLSVGERVYPVGATVPVMIGHWLYASHLLSGRPCPAGSGAISSFGIDFGFAAWCLPFEQIN